jgi:hypothetical protein
LTWLTRLSWLAAALSLLLAWPTTLPRLATLRLLLTLLPALTLPLTWLTGLSLLLPLLLSWLAALCLLAALSLAWLAARCILSIPRQRLNLCTEALDMIKSGCLVALSWRLALSLFAGAQSLLCLVYLLAQLIETFADAFFCPVRVWVHPTS